jgi:hypothetical protein
MTPEAIGVAFIGTLWVVSMAVLGVLVLRGEAPWQERARVAETSDEDPRTAEERAEDSLLSGGERVSKGRQRRRR